MKPVSLTNTLIVIAVVALTLFLAWRMLEPNGGITDDHTMGAMEHDHHDHGKDELPKGPQGGRLLSDGVFAVELTIFERGTPPEFRVFAYADGQPLPAEEVALSIDLERLDGQVDRFEFVPQAGFLRGQGVVTEPHSFDVSVTAEYQGKTHQWHYENHEGRTRISEAMATASAIETEVAGGGTIRQSLTLTGYVQTDPNRLSQVRARFPGIVKRVKRELGDTVEAGDVLATVQSNESLQTYQVQAPIDGLIVRREIQSGEATGEAPLFVIADLSRVWVELDVFGQNLSRVKPGQSVTVETLTEKPVQGTISWISPLAEHASQSVNARVELDNPDLQLRPGQFVRGKVMIAEHSVPLAVRAAAIQTFRDFDVVYARYGEIYEVRMLTLGRRDSEWVEVIDGLKPGTEYVTGNSYLIKADIEKSGAAHDH